MGIHDDILRIRASLPHLEITMREGRAQLIEDVAARYGVTLYPGTRLDTVVVSASDYEWLIESVAHDPRLDAVGRGYYDAMGGAVRVVQVPDWTCDPTAVAMARLIAVMRKPFVPVVRWLASIL
jgi:hypothetical protein